MLTIESLPDDVFARAIIEPHITYINVLRCVNRYFRRSLSSLKCNDGFTQLVKEDSIKLMKYMMNHVKPRDPLLYSLASFKMINLLEEAKCPLVNNEQCPSIKDISLALSTIIERRNVDAMVHFKLKIDKSFIYDSRIYVHNLKSLDILEFYCKSRMSINFFIEDIIQKFGVEGLKIVHKYNYKLDKSYVNFICYHVVSYRDDIIEILEEFSKYHKLSDITDGMFYTLIARAGGDPPAIKALSWLWERGVYQPLNYIKDLILEYRREQLEI